MKPATLQILSDHELSKIDQLAREVDRLRQQIVVLTELAQEEKGGLVNIEVCMERFGWERDTILARCRREINPMPHYKDGKKFMFKWAEVVEWVVETWK